MNGRGRGGSAIRLQNRLRLRVAVTCGLKFHSDHLAYHLQEMGVLERVISGYPFFLYANREDLDRSRFRGAFGIGVALRILNRIICWQAGSRWIDYAFARLFDRIASWRVGRPDVVICWAWSGVRTLESIKRQGGIAVLEECGSFAAYQTRLLAEEYSRLGLEYGTQPHPRIYEVERAECEIADYVLCPSTHVARSLVEAGVAEDRVIVLPYGVDLRSFRREPKKDNVFRILFVGTIGVRKGVIYLLRALERLDLPNFECVLIGEVERDFRPVLDRYRHLFRHIRRVPHKELFHHYSNASVFVLPSLDEGMAYVQLEAMACGVPVIYTPNSGAEGVIRDGQEGFIVPIRNPDAIRDRIEYLYHHPRERRKMADRALRRAGNYTWEAYAQRLVEILAKLPERTGRCPAGTRAIGSTSASR